MLKYGSDQKILIKAPFPADEEKPYIFISYAHTDRYRVFPIIKDLYETGCRIWYDEGLEIGDNYYQTLKDHVKNCHLFLLFASSKSAKSVYITEHEIPQAMEFERTIIVYQLDKLHYFKSLHANCVFCTSSDLLQYIETSPLLQKTARRKATGHKVAVNLLGNSRDLEYDYLICENGVKLLKYMGKKRRSSCLIDTLLSATFLL